MGRCLPSLLAEEERESERELLAVGGRKGSREALCGGGEGRNLFWSFSSLIFVIRFGFVVDEALYLGI